MLPLQTYANNSNGAYKNIICETFPYRTSPIHKSTKSSCELRYQVINIIKYICMNFYAIHKKLQYTSIDVLPSKNQALCKHVLLIFQMSLVMYSAYNTFCCYINSLITVFFGCSGGCILLLHGVMPMHYINGKHHAPSC